MAGTVHALDYLAEPQKHAPTAVCVAFGDEAFLKRLVLRRLEQAIAGDATPAAHFDGTNVPWRNVMDEVATVSLFGTGRRLAVVEDADDFVKKHRAALESYVAKPSSAGILVLDVQTWLRTTRLYGALNKNGLQIDCRLPKKSGRSKGLDEARLVAWLTAWAQQQHQIKLSREAVELLLDLVGPQLGLLDQELAKLALFADPQGRVPPATVRQVAGGWRTKTAWELIDAVADGNSAAALHQLDRLLQAGEHPQALFGPLSWSLRRFAAATRIYEKAERQRRRITLQQALQQAGFRPWQGELQTAERQLKQMGRERAGQLYRWLLELDLGLKGSHSQEARARLALEKLCFRLDRRLK